MQNQSSRPRRSPLNLLDSTFQYWALAPAVMLFALLTVYPVANLVRMSMSSIDFAKGEFVWTFAGAKNLATFADDWLFRTALRNTVVFVVAAVSIEMVLGFSLALVASQVTRGSGIYRTILVIPILVPAVAIGSMWKLMYNYDFGIINTALQSRGPAGTDLAGRAEHGPARGHPGRHVALDPLCLSDRAGRAGEPARGGAGGGGRRWRECLAAVVERDPAAGVAHAVGGPDVPDHRLLQGL